jgi:formylglycine-generating enzyme required for sulfatase activity
MPPSFAEVLLDRFVDRRLLVSGGEGGERTITVAHEALFRVWDTLRDWLLEDRKALMLRARIEDAAAEWDAENRAESRAWPEERILDAVREIGQSGVSLNDVARPDIVRAFLGPTDLEDLKKLPALTAADDDRLGSGLYGANWRLPLSHKARASLGVRLDLLGDRRPGVGLRADGLPDIDWCQIDGGEVTIEIRSDPDDLNSEVVDTRTRPVQPFSMARYPVTFAQFQAFLQECYRDGQWRLPPGFDLPADYPPPKHRGRYGNHPIDTASWYDAAAFCHWLSARLGERFGTEVEVRLPTEFEWQLAATGGDPEMIYPWGPDWDLEQEPWRANTYESGLGRSTAVGMYPAGVSKAEVLDMAGTVWEWCPDAFRDLDDSSFPAEGRVLRGGSWRGNQGRARCAFRLRLNPDSRFNDGLGFRVVCLSPTVEP